MNEISVGISCMIGLIRLYCFVIDGIDIKLVYHGV